MGALDDFRQEHPDYNDMPDGALADALHRKFYSDLPRAEFDQKIGLADKQAAAPPSNLQPGFLSDDPRDWASQQPGAKSQEQRGTFVPLATDREGKTGLAVPGIIHDPIEASQNILRRGPVHPSEVTGQMGAEGLAAAGAAQPGSMLSPRGYATREAIQQAAAAEAAKTGPHLPGPPKPTGLEQWMDKDGVLNANIRPTNREGIVREAGELPTPVDLPRAAVGGTVEQATAGGLSSTPLGTPIINASRKATDQLNQNVKGVSEQMGNGSVVAAGEGARDSVLKWIKKDLPAANADNYAAIDKLINKNVEVPLSRTRVAAGKITADDIESASVVGRKTINDVREAINRPGMTYEGIKLLRTNIREKLDAGLEPGVSARYLGAVHKALGEDLRFAVGRSGNKFRGGKGMQAALDAFEAANSAAAEGFAKRESLLKIIGSEGKDSAESVLERLGSMANAKGGADIARLHQAKSVMGEGAWKEVGSALLNRMGETKDGFSIARWRTAYEKLSEDGKHALFGSEHKATLDKIFRVGGSAEQLAKWGNPSGSARGALTTGAVMGLFLHPYAVLGAAAADYGLSRVLASPASSKKAAGWMQRYADYAIGPTPARAQLLQQSSRLLAEDIAAQSNADPRETEKKLAPKQKAPAPVKTIEDALRLPKGIRFLDPNGVERVR